MRFFAAALALFCLPAPSLAAVFNDFLPGPKAMGMGMAYSAIADDPYAMYYNPAGTANTPYIQAGTSLARLQSPVGTLTAGTLVYLRPFDPINTATVGASYYAERQTHGGDRDDFLFHYSQELRLTSLPLSKPLKVGGNFKFFNVDKGTVGSGHFGMGFDGGLLARANSGLSASVTLRDLSTNVGVPHPVIGLGVAYVWQRWLTFAGDMRVRSGLTDFYPGLEASFHQGLLKARIGRGFQLDGVGTLAMGMGVDFSPLVIDVAATFPTGGVHRSGGGFSAGLNYRFGAPSFAGRFVGQAASQAETLKADILELERRKKDAEAAAKAADTNREIAEGEQRALVKRVRELEDQYRLLQKERDEADYGLKESEVRRKVLERPEPQMPRVTPPPPPKKAPSWPRKREIKDGDTLRTLAKEYYGDPNQWEPIYQANREKIDRGLPAVGAVFSIPEPPKP